MHVFESVLWLLAACIGLALLARRFGQPYAVVLILGGMALAFVPAAPDIELAPDIALALFLPPLLMGSAYRTDWRAFRSNLRPILLLAVGCVIFTAFAIAWVARLLLPDLPWAAAIALGAILAPPDAVAAAAVLARLRLPRRIVSVLEGESLINDGSALVLYRLAVAAALAGATGPAWAVGGQFLLVAAGGIAFGLAVGRAGLWAIGRLHDPMLATATSFIACYLSFLGAEALHVSGVLAVVTTGIMFGQAQHRVFDAQTRVQAWHVWQFIEFVLTSLVFILIGLSLNEMIERLAARGWGELLWMALVISVTLIVTRFVWVFPVTYGSRLIPAIRRTDPSPPWQHVVIISWAGMRGVVSLAVALALPEGFPERDLIVFLAFVAILATLVLQGTTLEWLIRRLDVARPAHEGGADPAEARARHAVSQALLHSVEARAQDVIDGPIAADLLGEYRDRAGYLHRTVTSPGAARAERQARLRIRLDALEAARARMLSHHRDEDLADETLMKLAQELDLEELRLRQILG